jgi:hypothetical protein
MDSFGKIDILLYRWGGKIIISAGPGQMTNKTVGMKTWDTGKGV